MKKNTLEDYKKAVKSKYENDIQNGEVIIQTTPAAMRDLCLSKWNAGMSVNDERIFRTFFDLKETEDLRKGLVNCNIALFKPIRSFLKGEQNTENLKRIDLAALLVDFEPRPFAKFNKLDGIRVGEVATVQISNTTVVAPDEGLRVKDEIKNVQLVYEQNKKLISRVSWFAGAVVFFTVLGYVIKNNWFPEKQCMEWVGDHYEEVDCNKTQQGIMTTASIVPINPNAKDLKKLNCKNKITFFKNEKPLVWYSKVNGEVELYDRPGFHPITDKPLKPITNYMIHKYNLASK